MNLYLLISNFQWYIVGLAIFLSPFFKNKTNNYLGFSVLILSLLLFNIYLDNTNGVFSDVLVHSLPNGALVGLSNEIYSDAQGIVYEAIGIGPNEENIVPLFSNDDFTEEKDSGIDRAIELLITNSFLSYPIIV